MLQKSNVLSCACQINDFALILWINTGAPVSAEIIALPAKIKNVENMSVRFFTLLMTHRTIPGIKLVFERITALFATAFSFSFTVSF